MSCPLDVNARGGTHGTPLYAALVKGYSDIALLLLKHGATVNVLESGSSSPSHKASNSGRRDIVEFLLERHRDGMERERCYWMRRRGMENVRSHRYRYGTAWKWTPVTPKVGRL